MAKTFEFDRYINGTLMAEGVTITRQETLEGAGLHAERCRRYRIFEQDRIDLYWENCDQDMYRRLAAQKASTVAAAGKSGPLLQEESDELHANPCAPKNWKQKGRRLGDIGEIR